LNHEGEYVRVDRYIHALNTFETENRFHLFDSTSIVEEFSKFRITGKIIGQDVWYEISMVCHRLPFLEIDSQFNIIPMKD
jgi:hypothetical protein